MPKDDDGPREEVGASSRGPMLERPVPWQREEILAMRSLARGPLTCPDVRTEEGLDRFFHRDLRRLDPLRVWGEELAIRRRLAELVYSRRRGDLIHVTDGVLVYEVAWYVERLDRLHAVRRYPRGVAA